MHEEIANEIRSEYGKNIFDKILDRIAIIIISTFIMFLSIHLGILIIKNIQLSMFSFKVIIMVFILVWSFMRAIEL